MQNQEEGRVVVKTVNVLTSFLSVQLLRLPKGGNGIEGLLYIKIQAHSQNVHSISNTVNLADSVEKLVFVQPLIVHVVPLKR